MMLPKNKTSFLQSQLLSVPLSCLVLSLLFADSYSIEYGASLWVVNDDGSPVVDLYLKAETENVLSFRFEIVDNNTITDPNPVRENECVCAHAHTHTCVNIYCMFCILHLLTDFCRPMPSFLKGSIARRW